MAEPLATAFVRIRPAISAEDAAALERQAAQFRQWADELDEFRDQFVVVPPKVQPERDPERDEITAVVPLYPIARYEGGTDGPSAA